MSKTLKEFMELNMAPISLEDVAEQAKDIYDCYELSEAANWYLIHKRLFEIELKRKNFELG